MAILLYNDGDADVLEIIRKLIPNAKLVRVESTDDAPSPLLITEDGVFSGYEIYSYLREKGLPSDIVRQGE
ncbi:hypothetical protein GCM10007981_15830 [Thermocladium modestius]|uniref:Uncharacterized protein n=1 Tax=Thermocladium modestius TaxID=62609 RepID=A0A830H044_9CREN|nr:hypothetical protein [Thermocladium modestius]GGP21948.1 hypothetical protein GCM10007981_15830 [Thermocladium modestius]